MKIKRTPATEMAMPVPCKVDFDAMKVLFPTPNDLTSYPSPDTIRDKLRASGVTFTGELGDFVSKPGVAYYRQLYFNAIQPLAVLYSAATANDKEAFIQQLLDHPICNRSNKDPRTIQADARKFWETVRFYDAEQRRNYPDEYQNTRDTFVTYLDWCITNLLEWIYISSNAAYAYIREFLLEKARYVRKFLKSDDFKSIFGPTGKLRALPQRPTTSRSGGKDETPLGQILAGYKIIDQWDPDTGELIGKVVQLVTWFFTQGGTKRNVYTDYFDVGDNINAAMSELRRSELYRGWASKFSPREYANVCRIFQVGAGEEDIVLKDLQPISHTPN